LVILEDFINSRKKTIKIKRGLKFAHYTPLEKELVLRIRNLNKGGTANAY